MSADIDRLDIDMQESAWTDRRCPAKPRQRISRLSQASTAAALLFVSIVASALNSTQSASLDLVILVENSTAVQTADPEHALRQSIGGLIRAATGETRIALISYDDLAFPIAPLTYMTAANKGELLSSLGDLEFQAQGANLSAGLERAIYEIARNGRDGTARLILLIQSGVIRTGDFEQDLAFRRWAIDVLAKKAKQMSIPIRTLSFGPEADIALAQDLADITGGSHIHSTSTIALNQQFGQLQSGLFGGEPPVVPAAIADSSSYTTRVSGAREQDLAIRTPIDTQRAESLDTDHGVQTVAVRLNRLTETAPPSAGPLLATDTGRTDTDRFSGNRASENRRAEVSDLSPPTDRVAGTRLSSEPIADRFGQTSVLFWAIVGALSVALIAALAALLLTRQRNKPLSRHSIRVGDSATVRLVDLSGISGQSVYPISGKLVRVCRTAGRNSDNVVCLTIPDDVISREHAYIEYRDGNYFITDRETDNGTYVNGRRIRGTQKLKHGDRIRFATFEFGFEQTTDAGMVAAAGPGAEKTVVAPIDEATIALSTETPTPSGGLTLVHGSKCSESTPASTDSSSADGSDVSDRTVVR